LQADRSNLPTFSAVEIEFHVMDIIFLVYGAAFLLLGTAILVQPRQDSVFALSKILWLLAGFGLLHGVNEWLDMWKLIHGSGTTTNMVGLGLLLGSFGFLLEFGRRVVLVANTGHAALCACLNRVLRWPIYALLAGTLAVAGLIHGDSSLDLSIWARYLVGFPGAVVTGIGFLLYYRSEEHRLVQLGVKPYFSLAGVIFIGYGVLGGLVVPAAQYFPANWINQDTFRSAFDAPVQVFRAICAVLAAFAVVNILRIFNWERTQRLSEALERAQANATRFKDLVESSSDWVWEVDTRGTYTYASPKIKDILGYTPDEVLGRTPFDLMPQAEADRVKSVFTEVVASQCPCFGIENTNRHKDGRLVVLETNCVPVYGPAGTLRGYRGMDRDITERKKAEVALRQSEERLAEAQRIAKLGGWDWDIVHGDLHWSDEIYEIFGLSPEGFGATYEAFLEAVHPDDRGRVRQAVKEALDRSKPYGIEHRIVRPDGLTRVVQEQGEVTFDADGRPIRMVGTVQDITGRKAAEQRLRQAASVFENTNEGVIITGRDLRIEAINKAFTRITGYTEADTIGKTPRFLQSGRHTHEFYQAMWESLNTTSHWQGEIWNRTKDGVAYPEWLTISEVRDENNAIINYIGVFSDISALKASQDKLEYAAHHDALTGLPNRTLFRDRLEQALVRSRRHDEGVALLYVDLDRFKVVNDTLGHEVGDLLLQEVGRRLVACIREEDTVARMGGDEFVVIQQGVRQPADTALLATRLLAEVSRPMPLAGHDFVAGLSVGISLYPEDGDSITTLLKKADAAMYRAKDMGRNSYQFFVDEMTAEGLERLDLEQDLRRALERGELFLQYQPQIDLKTGEITGVEALLRWQHPRRGIISPTIFIPMAEDIGLIGVIGEWVLHTACAEAKAWDNAGLRPVRVAVNVSGRQVSQGHVCEQVQAALEASGLDPRLLEIEVTESVLMKDAERAVLTLSALKAIGVTLAIDDFGTGYSSLSYLKCFPLDKIKIDKSFVDGLPENPDDAAIATAIIAMAHSLQRTVIAEGVETEVQLEFLRSHGCDEIQGYLFSKPLGAQELIELLRDEASCFEYLSLSASAPSTKV
jgi:diguanylate cyclase (GGDEF)-like protein/PAS domain S-box-containing protein